MVVVLRNDMIKTELDNNTKNCLCSFINRFFRFHLCLKNCTLIECRCFVFIIIRPHLFIPEWIFYLAINVSRKSTRFHVKHLSLHIIVKMRCFKINAFVFVSFAMSASQLYTEHF